MGTNLQSAQGKGLTAWVADEDVQAKFEQMLGDTIPVGQFVTHMMTAFQDDKVVSCSDKSKYQAIHECAILSLLPTLGQVILIPYKDTLKAMPTWQGYKAVMERHPKIVEVSAALVHNTDSFSFGTSGCQHEYDPFDPARDIKSAKDIRGGYCTIIYANGRPPKYHFTPVRHMEKARQCAKTQNVWTKWYEQMALKTCYRDCYARRAVPVDPLVGERMERLTKADDINLGNDPNRVVSTPRLSVAEVIGSTTSEPYAGPESEPASEAKTKPEPVANEDIKWGDNKTKAPRAAAQAKMQAARVEEYKQGFIEAKTQEEADELLSQIDADTVLNDKQKKSLRDYAAGE